MLTDTQKSKVRGWLGYPDGYRFKHIRLESVLDNLSPEAEILLQSHLDSLDTIEEKLITTGVNAAGVRRVDEVWFENGGAVMRELRKAGRMYVTRISILTGVPTYSDPFSGNGYLGDSFFPGNGEGTGGQFYNVG